AYMGTLSVTFLVLGAVLEERAASMRTLETVNDDLQQALRARDQFLSIASHELRTPLTTLRLQIDGLLRAADMARLEALAPDKLKARAERLAAQAERLGILIRSLLDVSRITGGRLVLEREDVDLVALVHDVIARHDEQLIQSRCPVTVT